MSKDPIFTIIREDEIFSATTRRIILRGKVIDKLLLDLVSVANESLAHHR